MSGRTMNEAKAEVTYECGCGLSGGGWLGGDPASPIPFSAPRLCAKHSSDLIAVLCGNARIVGYHNASGERLLVVAEPIKTK